MLPPNSDRFVVVYYCGGVLNRLIDILSCHGEQYTKTGSNFIIFKKCKHIKTLELYFNIISNSFGKNDKKLRKW